MPILRLEPTEFPADLLVSNAGQSLGDRNWCVLHTRPRQEKSLTRDLRSAQIPHYLPLIPSRRLSTGRRVQTSYLPLFQGYVPIFADDAERLAALRTRRVVQSLEVADQEQFFEDIWQVKQLISADVPIMPEARLVRGDRVEIRSGALRGMQGVVWRASHSQRRFAIKVNFLQLGASVIADDFELKVLR